MNPHPLSFIVHTKFLSETGSTTPFVMKILQYVGDCTALNQFLAKKTSFSWPWCIVHFFNVLLRSVGQVVFVNNPFSGLLILVATFIPNWRVGLATFLAGSIATISEMVLRMQPRESMMSGLTPLNAVLVGSVTSSLYPTIYATNMDAKMWIFICTGAFVRYIIPAN